MHFNIILIKRWYYYISLTKHFCKLSSYVDKDNLSVFCLNALIDCIFDLDIEVEFSVSIFCDAVSLSLNLGRLNIYQNIIHTYIDSYLDLIGRENILFIRKILRRFNWDTAKQIYRETFWNFRIIVTLEVSRLLKRELYALFPSRAIL